jgi:hypothetical protein
MLKGPLMVADLDISSATLDLTILKNLLIEDLPLIVFSNDLVTKMHNSSPIAILCNAR